MSAIRVCVKDQGCDIYCGRGGKDGTVVMNGDVLWRRGWLGNPFRVTTTCSREQAIARFVELFEKLIETKPSFRRAMESLRARVFKEGAPDLKLGCWCREEDACHVDEIIRWLADE